MAAENIALLGSQWRTALLSSPILGTEGYVEYLDRYCVALSTQHVSIQQGATLEDSQMAELNICIGHRKEVRTAAATFLLTLYASNTTVNANQDKNDDERARQRMQEESSMSPLGFLIPAPQEEEKECFDDQIVNQTLTEAGLFVSIYKNKNGVQWRSVSGTALGLESYLYAMREAREAYGFPTSFDRAWQDNRPMPFFYQDSEFNLLLMRVPNLEDALGATVSTITDRLVIMYSISSQCILTYHRCDKDPLEKMIRNWKQGKYDNSTIFDVVDMAIRVATRSYRSAVRALQEKSEELADIDDRVAVVEGLTLLQKKAAVYRRCITSAGHALDDLAANAQGLESYIPLIVDALDTAGSQMEEIIENTGSTIDMQMALDGFRASVNTRIFTYISVICQPIGLATGWYGMNFANMPELAFENSYFAFIGIVLSLALLIIIWFVVRHVKLGY